MLEKVTAALASRACLVTIFAGSVIYKALAVFEPSIHGHGFDSDEAILGLMGLRTLEDGEFALFFYGQDFGGGLEYLLTVAVAAVLSPSVTALRIVALLLRLAADWVFYRVTCLGFEDRLQRNMALLLFVTMSSYFHGYLARLSGIHHNNLLLGLVLVYLFASSQRVLDRPILKGVVIGLGLWSSDAILIFLIPSLALGLVRHAREPRGPLVRELPRLAQLLAAAALACSPRLYFLIARPASWTVSYEGGSFSLAAWPVIQERLAALLPTTLPAYFYDGLVDAGFTGASSLGALVICATCVGATLLLVSTLRRRLDRDLAPLALMLVFWSSLAALVLNGEVYDRGLRYLTPMQPFAAMSVALLVRGPGSSGPDSRNGQTSSRRSAVLLATTFLLAALGISSTWQLDSTDAEARSRAHVEIIRILTENDVHHGWADYWASYDITFRAREDIKLSPLYTDRIPAYADEAKAAQRRAFVFRIAASGEHSDRATMEVNERALRRLSQRLGQSGGRASTTDVGPYRVVIETPR